MRKLKLFFACLLMAVLSIGQVWAADVTTSWTATSGALGNNIGSGTINTTVSGTSTTQSWSYTRTLSSGTSYTGWTSNCVQLGKNGGVENLTLSTSNIPGTIKSVAVECASYQGKHNVSITVGETEYLASTATASWTTVNAKSGTGTSSGTITISFTGGARALYIKSITVVYNNDAPSTPAVSADPDEVEDVIAEGVTDQTINLTYENITDYVTEVSVHPNADGTGTLSPAWLTASVSDADNYATVTYSVSANEGAARTAYIKVYTTDGDKEATTIIPVSQVKYSAPTGTFELFSGDIEEGDYLIVADGAGMNTTVSSSRLQYTALTLTGENYVNPDESVIWHIAESATAGYWTIYSGAESKYAAATGSNNQAQMLESGTDNKSLWEITHSEAVYTITNNSNSRFLKKNGTYGFGCYADGTVSLYKKQVAGQPKAPTFSVEGGNYESAQTVELSCETEGATIHYTLDGTKPTSSSPTYSTALNISSTTTVKAVAIKDDVESTVATATYTIVVWQTVDEIWSSITSEGPTNANVWGYVSQANVGGYNNNYYISVDGSLTANQLEIYKGDNAGNTVAVGDKVHVNGDLTIFNEIKEFKQNTGVIVHYEAKGALQSIVVDGTPTKTEYAANEDFDPAGLKVYGTYANGFVGEITEGITWGNDLTDGKVTESTTVHVTATVSEIASPAYDVAVTIAAKTLLSIAVDVDSYTIYTGEALPQPNVTATYSEGDPENVNAFAVYDSENVFDTEVIDDPDPQTITVSYTFGGETKTATYTVSVQDYENADNAPYSVTEALHIITAAIGNTESAREIVVTGTVSVENISGNKNRYKISDGVNELLVYAGKGFNNENFTNDNYPKVGDVVKVKGKVINYNNNTPEFASGKSYLLSQVRPATIAIENVASFEVGADDLEAGDLTITTASNGAVTFASSNHEEFVTIVDGKLRAVAAGTATITANLAATANENALNYAATSTTFDVTVIAAQTKYTITFDSNDADGGSAPEAIADQAEGANVTLPANTWTKTGYTFTGWKVYDENEDEVTVTANAFEMPASPVTIKAQWAEISVWATTYTSNVTLTTVTNAQNVKVKFTAEGTEYDAVKAGTGKAGGSIKVTVPAQATTLHLHAAGWSGENPTISIDAPDGVTVSMASISATADAGINSNSPFTLEKDPIGQYIALSLSGNTDEIELTFSVDGGNKRFVIYGVNQEGGILPVLDHITITGTMTNTTGWKTGDNIVPEGLTVNAIYTLNNVEQTPVEVDPNDVVWSHAALVENQTEVTLTATYEGKNANKVVTIAAVETGDPTIITDPTTYLNFGSSVEKDAVVASKTITVTLKNITSATATLGGETGDDYSAFSIDDTEIVDGDVITVSVNTGTVGVYAGTVTIKDDNSETQKVITLSMTVVEPEVPETAVATDSKWVPATEITDGMQVLIVGVNNSDYFAMGAQANNNRTAVQGAVDGEGVFTPGVNTMAFTVVDQLDGTYALQASNGKYLYAASSSSNYLRSQAGVDDNAKWTLSLTSAVAESSSNRNVMQFNSGSSIFSCYASASQKSIALYVPKPAPAPVEEWENIRDEEVAPNAYYTMCLDKAVTAVQGASIWKVISKSDNSANPGIILEEVTTTEAGRPYIFFATLAYPQVQFTGNPVNGPLNDAENHGLVGSFTQQSIAPSPNNYIIYNNELYYVNSGNVYVGAHRAYLDMTGVPPYDNNEPQQGNAPRRRVTMAVHGEKIVTGIDAIDASEAPVKLLINGQIFIIRGEKMYNVNGQVVK